jgi:hypothetical protein
MFFFQGPGIQRDLGWKSRDGMETHLDAHEYERFEIVVGDQLEELGRGH